MISRDNRTPNDGVVPCPNVGDSREADHARNRPGSCDRCCEHVRRLDGATPCSPLHGVAPVDIGRGVVLEAIGWTGPVQPFFIPCLMAPPDGLEPPSGKAPDALAWYATVSPTPAKRIRIDE
jgi:hypothetical protein